jgi:succinyl-CoA synthetase beta subunit
MNIHEYQARELLARAGIAVPPGIVATTPAEAKRAMERLGVAKVVVKAQVHAGGRGKAGGVKLAATPEQAERFASQILGMAIKGLTVTKVLVVPATDIASEAYVGVIVDRVSHAPVFMVSPAGGIDIEEVAAKTPEQIFKQTVDARYGLLPHQAMALGFRLYQDLGQVRQAADILQKLYRAFVDAGASLAEINPLVVTPKGEVVALDAKMNIDDNELERRPAVEALRDVAAENPMEVQAREANLTYIKLDGNVGCCVNGAGLAMATMDLVKFYGGEPANFLDIGGSSNPAKVVTALKIITADPNVKAILFNIFGGITRCDDVANGIVAATTQFTVDRPLVIRLTGTNEKEAVKILEGVGMRALTDMDAAVEQAVKLAKGGAAA